MVVSYQFLVNIGNIEMNMANGDQGTVECVSTLLYICTPESSISNRKSPVMIAENVSVGILSLPSAVATLGMVPYVCHLTVDVLD